MEQTAGGESYERWTDAAATALRQGGLVEAGAELARAEVAACLQRLDFWGVHLPANDQGPARAVARALARAACKRLAGNMSADSEDEIDNCLFWAGRAIDWAMDAARRKSGGARVQALLHAGGCLERAEIARQMVGRASREEAGLALRLIQAAREMVLEIAGAAQVSKVAA